MSLLPEQEQLLDPAVDEPRHAAYDGLVHTVLWLPRHQHAPLVAALQAATNDSSYQAHWQAALAQPDVRVMRQVHGHYRRPRVAALPAYADGPPRLLALQQALVLRLEQLQHRALASQLAARPAQYHAWWCTATQVWATTAPVSTLVQLHTHSTTATVQLQLRVQWQHPQMPLVFTIPNALRSHVVAL